jgi:hypothetical protein
MRKIRLYVVATLAVLLVFAAYAVGQVVSIHRQSVNDYQGLASSPGNPPTGFGRVYYNTSTSQLTCNNPNGSSCLGAGGGGTVTAVTASSPLASSGGATPNLTCSTCVTGSGAANQVAFWTSASAIGGNAAFTFNPATTLLSFFGATANASFISGATFSNNITVGPNSISVQALETAATTTLEANGIVTVTSDTSTVNISGTNLSTLGSGELDLGKNGTASGILGLFGATSGKALIQVAAVAGTPNPLQLPTATATVGQVLSSNGANPQVLSWTSAATGTVTSIATTSPITGGTITTTGTIACATCVTSAASLTINQLMTGAGSQASQTLGTLGTTTTVLHGNAGGAPTFAGVSLTADVTGTLPISSGGTGQTLANAAFNALSPMTTLGDIIFENSTPAGARLAGPTATNGVPQTLTSTPSGGLATAPVWSPAGVPTNAQTGTTYTYVATDRASYVSFSNAGAIAVTLPQAGSTGFASNFINVSCDIGAGTATITPTTSTISYTTGSAYTSGAATLALTTGQCAWIYSDNTNYFAIVRSGGGSAALSAITAAVGSNTIANGNNPQTWNWAQTTDSQDAFTFGETSAATNGTLTNGLANQALLNIATASASTSTPLEVVQGSVTGTTAFPAMQIETTWNNAGLTGTGLIFNVTDTSSAAASLLFDFRKGNTSQIKGDKSGNLTALTSVQTTATAPACTVGTAGFWCASEGTAFTNVASTAGLYPDSTSHEFMAATNGASAATPGMMVRSQPSPTHVTGQTATKTIYTLCAASAGACNVAGQYSIDWYFNQGGTACGTPGTGGVTFALTWVDNAGTHSAVALPMDDSSSLTATGTKFTFQTSNTAAWASGHFIIWSTGASAIQVTNTYTACGVGTGTWELAATAMRLQ